MCLIWGVTINKVFALAKSHTGSNQALTSPVPATGPAELGPQSGALAYHNSPHALASSREAISHPAFLRSTHARMQAMWPQEQQAGWPRSPASYTPDSQFTCVSVCAPRPN